MIQTNQGSTEALMPMKSRKYISPVNDQAQHIRILDYLLSGKSLSQLEASMIEIMNPPITSLFPRITKLRRDYPRLPIKDRWMGEGMGKYKEFYIDFKSDIIAHLRAGAAVSTPYLQQKYMIAKDFDPIIERVIRNHPETQFIVELIDYEEGGVEFYYKRWKIKS